MRSPSNQCSVLGNFLKMCYHDTGFHCGHSPGVILCPVVTIVITACSYHITWQYGYPDNNVLPSPFALVLEVSTLD